MGNEDSKLSEEEIKKRTIAKMDMEMREKLRKGVQYNMRIIIRGEVNTGKTSLWYRLQGKKFNPTYHPSESIQIAHIPWSYKVTDDNVKVEVWDVVDKARAPTETPKDSSLKLSTTEIQFFENDKKPASPDAKKKNGKKDSDVPVPSDFSGSQTGSFTVLLDATHVDVLKGANAVIFTMDQRREWTFTYIQREVPKIPKHVYVLILANYRDKGTEGIKVSNGEIAQFCRSQGGNVHFLECSMVDCFGLVGVKTFLYLPFLQMQKTHLEAVLRQNEAERMSVMKEFDLMLQHNDYDQWQNKLKNRSTTISSIPPKGTVLSTSNVSSGVLDISKQTVQTSDQLHNQRQRENQEMKDQRRLERERQRAAGVPSGSQSPVVGRDSTGDPERDREERDRRELEMKLQQQLQENAPTKSRETPKKEEGFFASFSSLVGGEKKPKVDAVVDDLRKLSEKRKQEQERAKMAGGKIEVPATVTADEFVPEPIEDDDGFWNDDKDVVKKDVHESSNSEEESSGHAGLLLEEEEGDEEITYTATKIVSKVKPQVAKEEPVKTEPVKVEPTVSPKTPPKEESQKEAVLEPVKKVEASEGKVKDEGNWLEADDKDKNWLDDEVDDKDKNWLDDNEEEAEKEPKVKQPKRQMMMMDDDEEGNEDSDDNDKRNPMMMDDDDDPDAVDFSYSAPQKMSSPSSPSYFASKLAARKQGGDTTTVATPPPTPVSTPAPVEPMKMMDDEAFHKLYEEASRIDPYDASTSLHHMQPIDHPSSIYEDITEESLYGNNLLREGEEEQEEQPQQPQQPQQQEVTEEEPQRPFFGKSITKLEPTKTQEQIDAERMVREYLEGTPQEEYTESEEEEDEDDYNYNYNYGRQQQAPQQRQAPGQRSGAHNGTRGRVRDEDMDIEEIIRTSKARTNNDPWSLDGDVDDDILTVKTYPAPQSMGVVLSSGANSLTSGAAHQLRTQEMKLPEQGEGRGGRGGRGARARGSRGGARGARGGVRGGARGGAATTGGRGQAPQPQGRPGHQQLH